MLNKVAFATSLALLTAGICLVFALLNHVAPAMFQLVFNAQFFGADMASLFPKMRSTAFVVSFIIIVVTAWGCGYVWARLYNRLAAVF